MANALLQLSKLPCSGHGLLPTHTASMHACSHHLRQLLARLESPRHSGVDGYSPCELCLMADVLITLGSPPQSFGHQQQQLPCLGCGGFVSLVTPHLGHRSIPGGWHAEPGGGGTSSAVKHCSQAFTNHYRNSCAGSAKGEKSFTNCTHISSFIH